MFNDELKIIMVCPWRKSINKAIDMPNNENKRIYTNTSVDFLPCYEKQCPFYKPGRYGYYCDRKE